MTFATLLVIATAAPTPAPEPREPDREWYGWQTALVDVAAASLFVAGAVADQDLPSGIGSALFVAGGPAIHAGHSQMGQALASLGLRVVLPLLGSLVAIAAGERSDWGLLGGAVPASAFDVIALSWRVVDE